MSVEFSKMIVSISCIRNFRHVSSICMIENWNWFSHAVRFWINWFAVFFSATVKIMKCLVLDISAAMIKTSWILIFLKTLFILFRYFIQLIWLIGAVGVMIIRRFFHAVFSSILIFLVMSVILIFWIFLAVSRLITCVHDFEFVAACLAVVIGTIKTIDDLIKLEFKRISIDLNVLWLDGFIWSDFMKLIVCKLMVCGFFFFERVSSKPQSEKHQFQTILVRKNPQINQPRRDQLKTIKIIKFDHELIVLSKHFYSLLPHTTRGENALEKNKQTSKSPSLAT